MKNYRHIVVLSALMSFALCLSSCSKVEEADGAKTGRIVFGVESADGATKAASSTSLEELSRGFRILGITRDRTLFDTRCLPVSGKDYYEPEGGPYYWPDAECDFYAAYPLYLDFQQNSGRWGIAYDYTVHEDSDIVAACAAGVTKREDSVLLEFRHLLSQLRLEAVGLHDGAKYSVHSVSVESGNRAFYDLKAGGWSQADTTHVTALGPVSEITFIGGTTGATTLSDPHNFCPGRVNISLSWRVSTGGEVNDYTGTVPMDLSAGEVTTVLFELDDKEYGRVRFTAEVKKWNEKTVTF